MITEKIIDVQRVQLLRSVNLKVYGDPRSRLRGHWASPDDITHLYFAEKALVVVNFGQRKDVMYRILESNADEQTVLYEVSGADYTPHTRTMVFLDDGTSWQVVGTFKSKLNYIGKEESPF